MDAADINKTVDRLTDGFKVEVKLNGRHKQIDLRTASVPELTMINQAMGCSETLAATYAMQNKLRICTSTRQTETVHELTHSMYGKSTLRAMNLILLAQ